MSKTLYLECACGISGDMGVAALIALGADCEILNNVLKSLNITGFETVISGVSKSGLDCVDFNVILDKEWDGHDHDMEYLHGRDVPGHTHDDSAHSHRSYKDVINIIDSADMTDNARKLARKIFAILAEAEAKVHGTDIEQVHFHEVGAGDSIVDVVSFAVCYDNLGITDTVITGMTEGCGTVRCRHGILPVPVPAVTEIVSSCRIGLRITDVMGELVTPTGAAIAAAVKTSDKLPSLFKIIKTGLGAGKRTYELPSILRAMIIEPAEPEDNSIYKLETDVDDCTGECLGYTMDMLYEAGAREVHYVPVYMKKNRPAYELTVICDRKDIVKLEQIIFAQTTTIGIRRVPMERTTLERRTETVHTSLGEAQVKICTYDGGIVKAYPEYDSVAQISHSLQKPFREVYEIVKKESNAE